MQLTENELIFLDKLSELSKLNSNCVCKPIIEIEDFEEEEGDE